MLALPAAASANDFQSVYREYKQTGTIKPCRFSDKQLTNAEQQTPPDVEQYAPSFLDALQSARERGADCRRKQVAPAPAPAPTPTTPAAAPPAPSTPTTTTAATTTAAAYPPAPVVPVQPKVAGVPSPPISDPRHHDSAPAAVWLLAALAALVALSAVFAGLAWWRGWSAERLMRPWRASWDDFSARSADLGSEFREWIRTGY